MPTETNPVKTTPSTKYRSLWHGRPFCKVNYFTLRWQIFPDRSPLPPCQRLGESGFHWMSGTTFSKTKLLSASWNVTLVCPRLRLEHWVLWHQRWLLNWWPSSPCAVLGLTLERPPPFTPCRERFFPLPGRIRTRWLSGDPGRRTPIRANSNAGQAGAARRRWAIAPCVHWGWAPTGLVHSACRGPHQPISVLASAHTARLSLGNFTEPWPPEKFWVAVQEGTSDRLLSANSEAGELRAGLARCGDPSEPASGIPALQHFQSGRARTDGGATRDWKNRARNPLAPSARLYLAWPHQSRRSLN